MSTFAVTIEKIESVNLHPNADRLDLVRLDGKDYEFVTQKGLYQPGETVVYFPVDSLLPEWIVERMELQGKLSHGTIHANGAPRIQNRVRTVKLRGQISQGLVSSLTILSTVATEEVIRDVVIGQDVTELLGVTKFEPPVVSSKEGNLLPMPELVSVYDIEGAQNFVEIAQSLMNELVLITEKIEGSHWSVTRYADGRIAVAQRHHEIAEVEGGTHTWWNAYRNGDFGTILERIWGDLELLKYEVKALTLRGEIIGAGIQGDYYGVGKHQVLIFEIEINGTPVDASMFLLLRGLHNIPTVPILSQDVTLSDWLAGRSIKEASNGDSLFNVKKLREGIVIKPLVERTDEKIGRVFLKQRSPVYLEKTDF